ncbi:MAG: hypothetical protein HUU11_05140 [Anaerolineales bacterium]|nr:hypothetical protein [Anaerolineales bacterium]
MPSLRPDQVQQIHEFIHREQLIHAIKLYREATGASLAEAKQAIEEMARNESAKPPDGTRDHDNPILEARIKSLLAKRRKVEAVKVYREEYRVGLKAAKDAVDRIEASMRRLNGPAMNAQHESAIGRDPFEERGGTGARGLLLLLAVAALAICGLAVYLLLAGF